MATINYSTSTSTSTCNMNTLYVDTKSCPSYQTEKLANITPDYMNSYYIKNSDITPNYISHGYNITKVEVLCPNKVLRFTFNDKTSIKTICTENDEFDFRFAFFIAFAKKLYKNTYTSEGIFQKAKELQYTKEYVKKVNRAIKIFEQEQKKKELEKQKEEELKEQKKRKIEKKNRRIKERKEKKIEEIAEAIKRANK